VPDLNFSLLKRSGCRETMCFCLGIFPAIQKWRTGLEDMWRKKNQLWIIINFG